MSASGGKADIRQEGFQGQFLNVRFFQKRSFRQSENRGNDRPLSARSGRCNFDQTGRKYKNCQVTSYNVVDLHIRVFLYDTTKFVTTVIPFRVASDIKRDAQ